MQNCGANAIKVLTQLRAMHATPGNSTWGVDGTTGKLADMRTYGVWEPFAVKSQTLKTAFESACLLLRVDDIVSGVSQKSAERQGAQSASPDEMEGAER